MGYTLLYQQGLLRTVMESVGNCQEGDGKKGKGVGKIGKTEVQSDIVSFCWRKNSRIHQRGNRK